MRRICAFVTEIAAFYIQKKYHGGILFWKDEKNIKLLFYGRNRDTELARKLKISHALIYK